MLQWMGLRWRQAQGIGRGGGQKRGAQAGAWQIENGFPVEVMLSQSYRQKRNWGWGWSGHFGGGSGVGMCTEDGPHVGQPRIGKSLEELVLNSSFAAFSDYLI